MKKNVKLGEYCENCDNRLGDDDKYCRKCGAKRGSGKYEPRFEPRIQCVYGPPPMTRTHKCDSCGLLWEFTAMIDKERFCPKCGGKVSVIEEKTPWE